MQHAKRVGQDLRRVLRFGAGTGHVALQALCVLGKRVDQRTHRIVEVIAWKLVGAAIGQLGGRAHFLEREQDAVVLVDEQSVLTGTVAKLAVISVGRVNREGRVAHAVHDLGVVKYQVLRALRRPSGGRSHVGKDGARRWLRVRIATKPDDAHHAGQHLVTVDAIVDGIQQRLALGRRRRISRDAATVAAVAHRLTEAGVGLGQRVGAVAQRWGGHA